ncbi:bifunctional diguanylate cyclase/phosphodiesterase [Actinoplanes oblitus]|uniref:Bifunctional diguanylate cyclase/phosphodiesterase n=1 Tax=Actinoplanes oblitus TaxID=3040509 RepID=A0ABY8W6K4_9ACTN|nr:bifunctional diguanylate cyclase/phosphodiesterase [Actinoplanes oblitus]WIM93461.1 bifunctional diguanylate cyclase/phosphodiesterase [Actinoplanes oblitus]
MRLPSRPVRTAGLLAVTAGGWLAASVLIGVLGTLVTVPAWALWPLTVGAAATTVAACWLAAASGFGAGRTFWWRLGSAVGLLGIGTVSQAADTLNRPDELVAMSPPTGLLYLAAVSVAVLAMLRLPGQRRTWRARIALWLDIAIVAVASGLVMLRATALLPVPVTSGVMATALRIIVLATACAAVTAIVKVGMGGTGPIYGRALWILSPAGLLGPASMLLAPALQRWPHLNATVAVLPPLAVLLTLSARAQTRANVAGLVPAQVVPDDAAQPGISRIPYVAVGVTAAMLLAETLRAGSLPAGLAAGAVVLIVLVLVRQHAALRDNSTLAERLADQARHDDLTGLPNRRSFTGTLQRHGGGATVAVCDLDSFAALNDRLGDDTGDEILRQAAARIALTVGGTALVARLLGDEFGVLLPAEHPLACDDRLAVALVQAFQAPLPVGEHDLLVTVTVGSAAGEGQAVPDLLRRAELALQAAQRVGANRQQLYTADLDASAKHHADLAAALRRGLDQGEFRLFYQPIVELPLGRISAVEALIRWFPQSGSPDAPASPASPASAASAVSPVSPAEFIPVAEQTGMIVDLGAWILDQACADAAAWRARFGDAAPRISVNVSARQLLDPELPALVADLLRRHDLPPQQVTLEITETAVFAGGPALQTVHALRGLGVGIALDDFGTGHSSLTLLRTCPVTTLKVDKSFIDELNGSPQQEAIAASLSGIASTLGLRAVAEGVETQDQADRLHVLGYRFAQGYHFARPQPATEIDASLLAAV